AGGYLSPLDLLLVHHDVPLAAADGDAEDRLLNVLPPAVAVAQLLAFEFFFHVLREERPERLGGEVEAERPGDALHGVPAAVVKLDLVGKPSPVLVRDRTV